MASSRHNGKPASSPSAAASSAGADQDEAGRFLTTAQGLRLPDTDHTQLTRFGGPNFSQLPVSQPHCPVNDMLRDGIAPDRRPGRPRP
jgi:hypothetical protein